MTSTALTQVEIVKWKDCFLYGKKQKYFDFSASIFGAIHGHNDHYSSSSIKRHLKKREKPLVIPSHRFLSFCNNQLKIILEKPIDGYHFAILDQEKVDSLLSDVAVAPQSRLIHDYEIFFGLVPPSVSSPIVELAGLFPHFYEICQILIAKQNPPKAIISASSLPYNFGNMRVVLYNHQDPSIHSWITNNIVKKDIPNPTDNQSSQNMYLDHWQFAVFRDAIKRHRHLQKIAKYQKIFNTTRARIQSLTEDCGIKNLAPDNLFTPPVVNKTKLTLDKQKGDVMVDFFNGRFFCLALTDEQWQKKIYSKIQDGEILQDPIAKRLFYKDISIFFTSHIAGNTDKKNQQGISVESRKSISEVGKEQYFLMGAIPINERLSHLDGKIKNLKKMLS